MGAIEEASAKERVEVLRGERTHQIARANLSPKNKSASVCGRCQLASLEANEARASEGGRRHDGVASHRSTREAELNCAAVKVRR